MLSHSIPPNRIPSRDLGSNAVTSVSTMRRRNHWVVKMVKGNASAGEKSTPIKNVISPDRPRGKALRERAGRIFSQYSADWLAEKADTTRNTSRSWQKGDCLPNFENSADLAREIPEWWDLCCELSGRGLEGVRRGDTDFHEQNAAISQAVDRELRRRGY